MNLVLLRPADVLFLSLVAAQFGASPYEPFRQRRRIPVTFLLDNIFLVALALISGGLLLWPLLKRGSGSSALSPLEATQLINHRNAIIVDLRAEKDFALGSLAGARNLPHAALGQRAAELTRFKARPVLIICDAGQQSSRAIATFKEQGFTEAYALAGGIAAWKQAALPLVHGGRDNSRSAPKDQGRKGRNENRSRSSRATQPVVRAAVAANDAPGSESAVEPGAAASSHATPLVDDVAMADPSTDRSSAASRVKELS